MTFSNVSLTVEEIISFLRQDSRLKEVYEKILYQKIITQSAQDRGLLITTDEIQAEVNRIRVEENLENTSSLASWLDNQMLNLQDLEQKIYHKLIARELAESLFDSSIELFFTQHRSDFDQVLLYRISVPYERLSQEIFYQIAENEISFYEAAHLYDVDGRRRLQCGYEGIQSRRNFPPELAEVIFNAEIGEVIEPLKLSDDSYNLFLIEEFIPAEFTVTIREEILNQMFQEWLKNELLILIRNS
jgi:parvulin-like peptidyl-prolyl isomerase